MNIPSIYRHLKRRAFASSLLVRLLFKERWFRAATFLVMAITVGVPLIALKTFPVTPQGVTPEVKISALDWLQSRALAYRAMNLSPESGLHHHVESWRMAIGNNPGSLGHNRAYLAILRKLDVRRKYWSDAVRTGAWLLKLSPTNLADLELTCLVFEHYNLDDLIVEAVESSPWDRSAVLNQVYLRALFETGNTETFLDVWKASSKEARQDLRVKLYRSALSLAHTPDDQGIGEQELLDQAIASQETEELGHRLQLFVSHSRQDLEAFQKSFRILVENFQDSIFDHLAYWKLLWNTGHKELARAKAVSLVFVPKSQRQVVEVANAYSLMDLEELAFECLQHYAGYFGFSSARVYSEAMILIRTEQWKRLRRLAIGIRSERGVANAFMSFSYYLEGKASFELNRLHDANLALQRVSDFSLLESKLGLYVGSNLMSLGYPNEAIDALWPERHRYRNDTAFWELIFKISDELSDASRLHVAAENLYRIAQTRSSTQSILPLFPDH